MPTNFSLLRASLIDKSREELLEYGKSYQRIVSKMLRDEWMPSLDLNKNGSIRATAKNSAKVAAIDQIMRKVQQKKGAELVTWFTDQVKKIENYNYNYFEQLSPSAAPQAQKSGERALRHLYNRLGYDGKKAISGGFLYSLASAPEPVRKMKAQAFRAIGSGTNFTDFQNQMNVFISGQGKQGLFETHLRTAAYDSFAQFDRQISLQMAEDLNYKRARYAGGIMDSSRDFCVTRVGRIFTIDEISAWVNQTWAGKNSPYDPFLDLGGHNCTHILDWLPPKEEADKIGKEAASEGIKGNTKKEIKSEIEDIFKKNSGINITRLAVSSKLKASEFKVRASQLSSLIAEYDIEAMSGNVSLQFKSTKRYYGSVTSYTLKPFEKKAINFGDGYDKTRSNTFTKTLRPKSRVDKGKETLSTLTHEFAHLITLRRQALLNSSPEKYKKFWKELEEIKTEYKIELRKAFQAGDWQTLSDIDLGLYARTNADEFWAESFAEYKLTSKPSKYAKQVGELADKYLRK